MSEARSLGEISIVRPSSLKVAEDEPKGELGSICFDILEEFGAELRLDLLIGSKHERFDVKFGGLTLESLQNKVRAYYTPAQGQGAILKPMDQSSSMILEVKRSNLDLHTVDIKPFSQFVLVFNVF